MIHRFKDEHTLYLKTKTLFKLRLILDIFENTRNTSTEEILNNPADMTNVFVEEVSKNQSIEFTKTLLKISELS
jgi:hypothetical protein